MKGFKNTKVWRDALKSRKKDEASEARDRLRTAYLGFRTRTSELIAQISRDVPFLTVHDITRIDALWEMSDLILGDLPPLIHARHLF